MKKRMMAMLGAFVLAGSLSVTAFAAEIPASGAGYGYGCSVMGGCYGLMWGEDGSFLDRNAFEERLDQAIKDGVIAADEKDAFLAQYDYCAENGGAAGVCGGGRGRGMGRGMGRGLGRGF